MKIDNLSPTGWRDHYFLYLKGLKNSRTCIIVCLFEAVVNRGINKL